MSNKNNSAFTLIEILLAIVLLGIVAGVAYVAIDPNKRFGDVRNGERSVEIGEIISAVAQYTSEQGQSLTGLGTIATCPAVTVIGTSGVNLTTTLVDKYIAAIPRDPNVGTAANTGYTICKTANGRVTVAAPNAENGVSINVTR